MKLQNCLNCIFSLYFILILNFFHIFFFKNQYFDNFWKIIIFYLILFFLFIFFWSLIFKNNKKEVNIRYFNFFLFNFINNLILLITYFYSWKLDFLFKFFIFFIYCPYFLTNFFILDVKLKYNYLIQLILFIFISTVFILIWYINGVL